ncbi:hypothetical protein SCP_1502760 [Sparassis crispa]|uniref:Pheromone n=1 Tax=Sparassis crispa TaxID=139825 RepID=A0A401H4B5_9APHY|nr:hypothetical protein SCP_1502760 [Sparassis crispa]GBE89268.1 hypothetical protein SCP_1502760 [Sparassis crispa]
MLAFRSLMFFIAFIALAKASPVSQVDDVDCDAEDIAKRGEIVGPGLALCF